MAVRGILLLTGRKEKGIMDSMSPKMGRRQKIEVKGERGMSRNEMENRGSDRKSKGAQGLEESRKGEGVQGPDESRKSEGAQGLDESRKYDAVLFDLDGTILNTLGDLVGAVNFVLRSHGEPERSFDEIRQFCGTGNRNLMRAVLPGGTSEEELDRQLSEFWEYYLSHDREETVPYPGIMELFQALSDAGIKIGVVSNKFHRAVVDLCEHFFGDLVGAAIGDGEGRARKPAPDACEAALRRLGVSKEKVLYVGDSEIDAQTAKNMGLPCVLVTWGFRPREVLEAQETVAIVSDVQEIREMMGC